MGNLLIDSDLWTILRIFHMFPKVSESSFQKHPPEKKANYGLLKIFNHDY